MDYTNYFAALESAVEFGRSCMIQEIIDAISGEVFLFESGFYYNTDIMKLTKVSTTLMVGTRKGDEYSIGLLSTGEILQLYKHIVCLTSA